MEIKRVYRESMPQAKLIGRRFTNADRDGTGTFARFWRQAEEEGWFEALKACKPLPGVSEDRLGAMRMGGPQGFEYWIGILAHPDAQPPAGFQAEPVPAGDVGVCWVCGSEQSGELYGMEASRLFMAALAEQGWQTGQGGWFFERYNCPRFTVPDEAGNVILDLGAYLAE